MKVVILGAPGGTGHELVIQALELGSIAFMVTVRPP